MRQASGLSLQGETVHRLGIRIASNAIAAGTVLNPDDLAKEFGVSRTVIREAFRTLETLGMIAARQRVGTTVQPSSAWDLLDRRVIRWRDGGPDAAAQLRELTTLRGAIEPTAAELAAGRASDAELAELSICAGELASAIATDDIERFALADARFHALVVQASRSDVLRQLLGTLEATLQSRYSHRLPAFSESSPTAVERHRELVVALTDRDSDRAAAVSRLLIRESQEELFRIESVE